MAFWRKHKWTKKETTKKGTSLGEGFDHETGEYMHIITKSDSVEYQCQRCDFSLNIIGGGRPPIIRGC